MKIGQHARLVAGVVVGLVVAGGTAFATTSDSSGTETAACITPSKYVRILPEDAECRSREVAISLPSMDTIAAIEGVVNENADALDALSASLEDFATLSTLEDYATLSDLDSLSAVVDGNGSDIEGLRADLAAELDQRTESDADLLDNFDNYYSAADVDGFLAEIYDGFSSTAEALDAKVSGDDLEIITGDIQLQIDSLAASLDQTGVVIDGLADELLNVIGDLSLSLGGRLDAVESTLALLSDVDNLGSTVSALQASVDSLTAGLAAANAAATANADAIDSLSASIAAAFAERDATIAALAARVAALEAATPAAP